MNIPELSLSFKAHVQRVQWEINVGTIITRKLCFRAHPGCCVSQWNFLCSCTVICPELEWAAFAKKIDGCQAKTGSL